MKFNGKRTKATSKGLGRQPKPENTGKYQKNEANQWKTKPNGPHLVPRGPERDWKNIGKL